VESSARFSAREKNLCQRFKISHHTGYAWFNRHEEQRGNFQVVAATNKFQGALLSKLQSCGAPIVSPDDGFQRDAFALLDAFVPSCRDARQCRLPLVDCPNNTPPESAFGRIYEYLGDNQLNGSLFPQWYAFHALSSRHRRTSFRLPR
jgi:hypothetical protein